MLLRFGLCVVVACLSVVFSIPAFAPKEAQAAGKDVVFIKAFYPLDEPRFHCIDIPGHRDRVRTTAALVVHTCKEGIWNLDGQFDPAAVAKGRLRMPEYDLCVAAASAADGAKLMLRKCDGTALQNWRFENYRLSLKAHPDKCITIGTEPSRLTRGGRRLPSRHMARSLALAACSEDALERQLWRLEKPMQRTGSIMPFKKSQ